MADILVPALGESVTEATVGRWVKAAGEAVKRDEVLLELETDKVALEVAAPEDGVLTIVAQEGATVSPGQILGGGRGRERRDCGQARRQGRQGDARGRDGDGHFGRARRGAATRHQPQCGRDHARGRARAGAGRAASARPRGERRAGRRFRRLDRDRRAGDGGVGG
jgi:pyruvate/2-oxoglutarate dehydrogenase complex dihydrolipoamide acyltransferase (E2) component